MTKERKGGQMLTGSDIDPTEAELERLAATRSAVDPGRRGSRRDIIVNAAVGHLATHARLSTSALRIALAQVFQTQALTDYELDEALQGARRAHLVETVSASDQEVHWQATAGVIAEATQDREWATQVLDKFGTEIAVRLEELGHNLKSEQVRRAPQDLIRAIAAGCSKSADGRNQGAEYLRPVEFDRAAINAVLERFEPQSYRAALVDLMQAAADPDDPFGTEIVHLLVVSSVLIGFIKKRDLGTSPSLTSTKLLLDTQVLVELVDEGTPEKEVVQGFIRLTKQLGGEIIVAEHSLEEWNRLWKAAELEMPGSLDDALSLGPASRLPANPFVAQFLRAKTQDNALSWRRFQIARSNVKTLLSELGVVVRAHGNNSEEDKAIVARMRTAMREIPRPFAKPRTEASIEADAESAAMVARWRRNTDSGMCPAYFVSADVTTGRAYRTVVPDDSNPLTVRPSAWLMYVAYITGDESKLVDIAGIVSNAVVRESFFGVATSYTLDEVVKLSELLKEDHSAMSIEDSREAAQLDLNRLLGEAERLDHEAVINAAAAEILQKRSARRDARAKRAERMAAEVRSDSEALARAAQDRADKAEEAKTEVSKELALTKAALAGETLRLRRLVKAISFGAVFIIALVGLVAGGVIRGWWIGLAIAGTGWYAVAAVRFVISDDSGVQFLLASISDVLALVLAWILGKGH